MHIQNTFEATFTFLEDRKYIHGSTLAYGLLDAIEHWGIGTVDRLVASYHNMLNEHGRYDLFEDPMTKNLVEHGYCSTFNIYCDENTYIVGVKGSGKPVMDSIPYDEESMISSGEIVADEKSASILWYPDKPILNILIALNKKLHLSILPTEGFGRWIVSRLDLKWQLMNSTQNNLLKIKLIGNIRGLTTKSSVELNGQRVGDIYFMRELL